MLIFHLEISVNLMQYNVGMCIDIRETDGSRYDAVLPVGAFDGVCCYIRKLNRNNFI
jgi:Flp pilus assembly CpaF family ATPase